MNKSDVAAALRTISQGFFDLSAAIDTPPAQGTAADAGRAVVAPARPDTEPEWLPPLEDDTFGIHDAADERAASIAAGPPVVAKPVAKLEDQAPEGSLTQCPKHRKAYTEGKFGLYCTAPTDDPEWGGKPKPDGTMFCSITPKNVDKWLRQHSGVPA